MCRWGERRGLLDGRELAGDDWHRIVGYIKQDILYAFERQWIAVYLGNDQLGIRFDNGNYHAVKPIIRSSCLSGTFHAVSLFSSWHVCLIDQIFRGP